MIPVVFSESTVFNPNPDDEKLIPPSLGLAALRPKLIEEEVLDKVPAAATKLENFVFVTSSPPPADPGLSVEQQTHAFLSASFETRHVEHDHLALDDAAFSPAVIKSEFLGASSIPGFLVWQQAHAVLSLSLLVRHVEQAHFEALAAAALNNAFTAACFGAVSVEVVLAPGRLVLQQAQAVLSASFETRHVEQDHLDEDVEAAANRLLTGLLVIVVVVVVFSVADSVIVEGRFVWQHTQADLSASLETRQVEQDHFAVFVMSCEKK